MTPKEKAEELVNKMSMPENIYQGEMLGKQCALIAVDEISKALHKADTAYDLIKYIDYWHEVKQEIEKL